VSEETKVTVKDVTAPAAPEVYEVTNLDTYIMGTAEPGSTVEAKVGNKVIGTTVAEKDGYFEIEIEAQKVGTVITVTAKNAAGNVSKATTVTVEQYIGWYYDEDGYHYINPKTGVEMTNSWLKEDGVWYHFNNKGILETGWVKVNGKWYFFSDDDETFGEMQTGWYKENNKWYFLDQVNGDMKVNWAKVGGKWYFFNKSGVMQTGWVKDGKTWYYLASSGAMQTGWIKEGKTWYYLANSGAMQSGWVKVNNKWYYLAASGAMKTGWVQVGAKWYYLYNDGSMAANTTIGKYKLGKDGAWIK
jgi:2',3'-cyclic-nucleotide 2'-phosphodiesterase/3'-nucleotidase/5'-nucleotidase